MSYSGRGRCGISSNPRYKPRLEGEILISSQTESTRGKRGELGQGLYSLGELQSYLAFEGDPKDSSRALYWLTNALNPVDHRPKQPDYSFSDLISLFVVRELQRQGVSLSEIAKAERYGRERFKVDRPFVRYDVATDGRDVCFEADEDTRKPRSMESANKRGQRVLVEPIRDRLRSVRYTEKSGNGQAYAWTPIDGVVLNPAVQFGAPVIVGTRVPTDDVAELADEFGPNATANRLSLDKAQIQAAVKFQQRLSRLL